jgi:DNA-binding LacI/PurR family transcriptional regulator
MSEPISAVNVAPRARPSRLRDVARLAGVSVPTASQALNGHARISAGTKERVAAAARELHYTPHAAARRLSRGRSDCVAIVPGMNMSGFFSDLFYRALLSGVGTALENAGFRMLITPAVRFDEQAPQFVQMARAREIDGMLLAGAVDVHWARKVLEAGTPVVLLDNYYPEAIAPAIVNDNTGGAYAATSHLAALGHRRIGFIGADVGYPFGSDTRAGYRRALRDAGVSADPALEVRCAIDAECARAAAGRLLDRAGLPTAIFAVTDMMALGVINAARDRGLRIPADLSVVGMDDIELASITNPPLTTVRVHKEDMGREAARRLLDLIHGRDVDPAPLVLPNDLVIRGTTGGPHGASLC